MTERPSDRLETLKTASDRVRCLEDEIARARSIACYKPVSIEKGRTSGGRPHTKEDDIIAVIELETQLKEEHAHLVEEWEKAHRVIGMLADPRYRTILSRYYILLEPMGDIAKTMGYSPSHLYKLKDEAKRAYSAMYSDIYKR